LSATRSGPSCAKSPSTESPALRRSVLDSLATNDGVAPVTRDIADQIGYSTGAVHRTLEDVAALAFVQRESDPGGSHRWRLRDWVRERLR
jgi:DNA-binding MarR family transcriptional regulator